ncbi:hypothetical protein AAVH_30985 [Aphelenchoides avenae]|nr:hypothetical protein AAVH_30985 [Aphelenchus avenae]
MLPTEAFTEAVAFLSIYDLNSLAVTNALCSALAVASASKMRWEEFRGLRIRIGYNWIAVERLIPRDDYTEHECLNVAQWGFSEVDMANFIAAAFPNCVFEGLIFHCRPGEHVRRALDKVAHSIVILSVLRRPGSSRHFDVLDYVFPFRMVKAVNLVGAVADNELREIVDQFRTSGVHELYYSDSELARQKITFF